VKSRICTLVVLLLAVSPFVDARQDDSDIDQTAAPLFGSHSLLQVSIEAPLTTLMKERPVDEYLDGIFSYSEDDGTRRTLDIKIRTRGKFRRKEKHCDFAPIRLNFRKKQVVDTVFAGQDKLKLVTHCQNSKPYYEQLVLREFLAYRFLNVLTDKSYRVRLLQINYIDTEGADQMTKLGFVIEDDEDVAKRIGMHLIKTGFVTDHDLDRAEQNLVSVFQFMIGNTEYSMLGPEPGEYCCHNIDLMSATKRTPFTPVAYDFDFSGLVNAPYAAPNPRFELSSVRQRLYRGLCTNNELLPGTLQRFLDNEDAIYAVVDELDLLSSRSRRDVTRYLGIFYKRIAEPKSVDALFIRKCNDASQGPRAP